MWIRTALYWARHQILSNSSPFQVSRTNKIKTRWSALNGQPPFPGWSLTIPRMVTHHPKHGPPPSKGWSLTIPWMVIHHPKDGHPPSKIFQKEVYYRLEIFHRDLTHKIKTRWSAMDGQPPSPGWSPNLPWMVTQHPKFTRRKSTADLKFGIWA